MSWRRRAASRRTTAGAGAFLIAVLAALLAPLAPPVHAGGRGMQAADAALYRIFLTDGGVLVSYGEFARVADRVILSVPIGGTDSRPVLHLLTIDEKSVDWGRTNAYADAARSRHYAETRGEEDFARLTRAVADALYEAGTVEDPAARLAFAEAARKQLAEWPQQHYGYRAGDLADMAVWLDQVVSELRVAAGKSSFDLTFVARPAAPAPVQLLPAPDLRERAELGLVAARTTTDAAERVSLLRAVLDSLQPGAPEGSWMADVYARASGELAAELKIDSAYAALTTRTLKRAEPLAARANVRALEALVQSVIEEDRRLQNARPAAVTGLLAALDARIDSARRLRLARDAWELRRNGVLRYWTDIREGLDRLLGLRKWLIDIRQLAGPSPGALKRTAYEAKFAGHQIEAVKPPPEVASAHSSIGAASMMAAQAADTRLSALRSGSMDEAWAASSAAAGSIMLLDQAIADLRRLTYEPMPGRTAQGRAATR